MTNQIRFDNYLLLLKSSVEVYVHGTLESSNQKVRDLLQEALNSIIDMQEETYNEMTSEGWYNVQNISTKEINNVIKKINNCK